MAKKFDREAMLERPHAEVRARYQAMFGEAPRSPNKTWMVKQIEERHNENQAAAKAARAGAKAAPAAAETADESEAPRRTGRRRAANAEPEPEPEVPAADEPESDEDAAPPSEETSDEERTGTTTSAAKAAAVHLERGRFANMTVDELRTMYEQKVGRATSSTNKQYLIWKIAQAEKGRIRTGRVVHGQRLEGTFAKNDRTLPLTMTADAMRALDEAWPRLSFTSRMSFMRAAIGEALASRGQEDAAAHFPDKALGQA
jgi:DNA-nicking Smr family endonuclease